MYRDKLNLLPLRQALHPAEEARHLFANPGVVDWLSKPEKYLVLAEDGEGTVHAASESALKEAQDLIGQVHGGRIALGAMRIHTYVDDRGQRVEPIMFTRVSAARDHAMPLLAIFKGHGADVQEVELQSDRSVIRAEAPLARLLGSEAAVHAVTDGTAHVLSWLTRYAPVPEGGDPPPSGWHQ